MQVALTDQENTNLAQANMQAPGTFSHELAFAKPGARILTITAQHADRMESHHLRLDAMARRWAG